MNDNIIPFIPGEEKKSEIEPLKIWGSVQNGQMILATKPIISTTCIRVPVSDGHLVSVHARFNYKPTQDEIIKAIDSFEDPLKLLELPSSPGRLLTYFYEEDRPQTGIDRMLERGMGISIGRLRADPVLHWKFVALSHNMIRGAAGGGLLTAELLTRKGFISSPESKKTR